MVAIVIVLFVIGLVIAAFNTPARKGARGERIVASRLREGLPEEYQILNDTYLPLPDGTTTQIDHIVVSPYGSNTVVRFCDSQSSDIRRTVIARQTILNTDISICLLDDPLPDTIEPARILPPDYASYIGNGRGLPLLELDQEEHAIIVDKSPISQGKGETSAYQSNDANRLKYYESAISGDSGDPAFFIYNQNPILLYCLHTGGGGGGPFTTCYASEIQNAMDELSSRYHKSRETLQFFDFSPNDKLEREFK